MFLFWHILLVSSFLPYLTPAQNPEEAKLLHSPQSVNVSLNEVAEFNCTANSDNIVWKTNGVEINNGQIPMQITQGIYLSTLKLTALTSLDNTNITCTAVKLSPPSSNESDPALLLVQGLLDSVSNLAVTPVNSTTVLISWSPPFTLEGVPILGYNVTITNTTSGENETIPVEGDTTMLYYSIDHPESTFTVTVVPINAVGAGDDASIQTTASTTTSQAVVPSVTVTSTSRHATTSTTSQAVVISFTVTSDSASETSSDIVMPSQSPIAGNNLGAKVGGPLAAILVVFGMPVLVIVCIYMFRRKCYKSKAKDLEPATPLKQTGSESPASKFQGTLSQPNVDSSCDTNQNTQNLSVNEPIDSPPADDPPPAYYQLVVDPPTGPPVDSPSADPQADIPDSTDHCENPNKLSKLTHAEIWYFRMLKKEEAQAKCVNVGDYLVRYNPEYENYFLTVRLKSGILHNIPIQDITGDPANPQYSIGEKYFSSICDLLHEYAENKIRIVTPNSEAILTNFIRNDNWSMCQEEYELTGKITGNGAFGDVLEAHLIKNNKRVVVKTCKSSHTDVEKRKFLHEADILCHYEHPNIVELFGVVANQDPLCIVMEHVGWVFSFFLQKKGPDCTKTKLTRMCTQVCAGMEYLEKINGIHCCLRARNCLVTENNNNFIVKISNFGTSSHGRRNVVHLGSMDSDSLLRPPPIKWTAPEALIHGTYTSASDVWSFGVLLWETFSLGKKPYPGKTDCEAKEKVIQEGSTLLSPKYCPEPVYTVMKKCWKYNEEERPTFTKLQSELTELQNYVARS